MLKHLENRGSESQSQPMNSEIQKARENKGLFLMWRGCFSTFGLVYFATCLLSKPHPKHTTLLLQPMTIMPWFIAIAIVVTPFVTQKTCTGKFIIGALSLSQSPKPKPATHTQIIPSKPFKKQKVSLCFCFLYFWFPSSYSSVHNA